MKENTIKELRRLRKKADEFPKLKGKAALITKIKQLKSHVERFKYDEKSNVPDLILKECKQAFNEFDELVQKIEQKKSDKD